MPSTPYESAVFFVGSLRSGKSACCCSAKPLFLSRGSTLIMKYMTSYCLIRSPCSARDLHSRVHALVYALGNHASTIACLFRKSDALYVLPSDAWSAKSGAMSPALSAVVADECPLEANARKQTMTAVNTFTAHPVMPRVAADRLFGRE